MEGCLTDAWTCARGARIVWVRRCFQALGSCILPAILSCTAPLLPETHSAAATHTTTLATQARILGSLHPSPPRMTAP